MAPPKLTEYERKRLENIKRNQEMIAALNIQSKLTQLSDATKRQRVEKKTYKVSPKKKPKTEDPIVIRRSLRTRGIAPESGGLRDENLEESPPKKSPSPSPSPSRGKPTPRDQGPYRMRDAYSGEGSDKKLIEVILKAAKKPQMGSLEQLFDEVKSCKEEMLNVSKEESNNFGGSSLQQKFDEIKPYKDESLSGLEEESSKSGGASIKQEFDEIKPSKDDILSGLKEEISNFGGCSSKLVNVKAEKCEFKSGGLLDLESLSLKEENIARVVPGRIMALKFLPCNDVRMVMVGNKFGNLGFWDMDSDNDGIFLYRPHTGPVSGIVVQQPYLSKIFTGCYDGFIRLMDAEKEVFDLVYSGDDAIFSLSQRPNDAQSLYFGEGPGMFNIWDVRTGKCLAELNLHESRINSIDFSSTNTNIMATSSSDGSACFWDLRCMDAAKPKALKIVNHERAVHSAYFSPSGSSLVTTSLDDTVAIVSGVNFEDSFKIFHDNQTGRWISTFRATWGWDDSYVFIGNMKRGVDIISPAQRRTIMTLQSPHVSAIPCRFNAHPYQVGMLAGATSGGQVYVWTS